MLHAPSRRRERILLFGPSGAGKSSAWCAIAEWLFKTKADARVWELDTDRTWDDMAPYDGHLDKIVTAFNCPTWDDARDAIRALEGMEVGPDDWLVVDMISRMWDKAQEGYFEKAYGRDIDEFFTTGDLAERAKRVGGEYGSNWQAINKMYGALTRLVMSRWPGHVLCCTPAQKLWEANQTTELSVQYPEFGRLGFKPQGQKDLPHQFRTILFMQQAPSGWKMTTAKERNPPGAGEGDDGFRGYVEGVDVKDFVRSYLLKTANWRL